MESTVKFVFLLAYLLACLICHPYMAEICLSAKPTLHRYQTDGVLTIITLNTWSANHSKQTIKC